MTLFTGLIGNAWGRRPDAEGPEHRWERSGPRSWTTACGDLTVEADDEFHGVPMFSLRFSPDAEKCDRCLAIYRKTWLSEIVAEQQPGNPDGILPPSTI